MERHPMETTPRRWLQYLVQIPFGDDVLSEKYRTGIVALRQIELWLKENHAPRALFDAAGHPRGPLVSVSFTDTELEKAMAYRIFCNELGLSHSLRQSRIVHIRCERTTPDF